MDADCLKRQWHVVAQNGDRVPAFFYAALFRMYPETRALFPIHMGSQRDRLVAALGEAVANIDNVDAITPFLQELGRNHARRYGVEATHYPAVGAALLITLEHFLEGAWTPETAEDWAKAYQVVADVMITGARTEQDFDPKEVAPQ